MAHRPRPAQSAHRCRSHRALRHRTQGKPRRALPRRLSEQERRSGEVQSGDPQSERWIHATHARSAAADDGRDEGDYRGDEVMATAIFQIWRGNRESGGFKDYTTPVSEGMVVLDAIHQIQAEQASDLAVRWNCKAGKCGSCSAEINGMRKLMCMTRLNQIRLDKPVTVEPMKAFPLIKDLVTDVSWNFEVKKTIRKFKPRKPDAPDGSWRMSQADADRPQEFR